jgi:hypothetical protein
MMVATPIPLSAPECGSFRLHPIALHLHADAFRVEVEIRVVVLLMHHVQMALQCHGRGSSPLPLVPGFLMITLPAWSTCVGSPKLLSEGLDEGDDAFLLLAGRGTALRSAKWFQMALGSKARTASLVMSLKGMG